MERAEWLSRIAEQSELGEEETERVLEILVEDLAAALRERRGKPLTAEVPPYFDRYVTAEISRVSGQISDLREEVERRFEQVDRGFEEVSRRFGEVDRRFDRIDRWFLTVGVPLILGILAIIVKVFFGP